MMARLCLGSSDKTIRVWNMAMNQIGDDVTSVATHDSKIVSINDTSHTCTPLPGMKMNQKKNNGKELNRKSIND